MTDQLPRPGFAPLPPPPGGMARALRDGRRLRLRRRVLGTSAVAAVLAVVAGTFAATASSGPGATDQLIPAVVPPTTATASPAASYPAQGAGAAAARPAATPAGRPPAVTAGGTGSSLSPSHATPAAASPRATTTALQATYRTPDLLRSYRTAAPAQGPNPSICSSAVSGGGSGFDASSDWCLAAKVTTTSRGHDLSVQVCRDSAGPAQLHFSRRLEVDLVVLAGTRPVWRWSTGHADAAQAHALDVAADACWTWTAPWTDVDGRGSALPSGDYTLSVTTQATELRAYDAKQATFSIG